MGGCVSRPAVSVEAPGPAASPFAAPGQQAAAAAAADGVGHRGSLPIEPLSSPDQLRLARSLLGDPTARDVTEQYEFQSVLGRGAFATTRLVREKSSGQLLACKSIHKRRLAGAPAGWADVRREMQVMYHLAGHPNMVQLLDTFEDNNYVHLVMELCQGGELVDRIIDRGSYTERDAAAIIRAVLEVVAYAHDLGCMHRDIKPDNLLILDHREDAPIKLADWGFSTFIKPGTKVSGLVGTCYYIAPEVLCGPYDDRADVWSCGVLLYILLCGRPPFNAVRDEDVFRMIMEDGVPNMSCEPWADISEAAKDAVSKMMTWSPEHRPSAREMLQHEWIRAGGVAGDNAIQPEVMQRMKSFGAMNKFKKQAALVIADHMPPDQIRGLRELFDSIDADGSGAISVQELRQALEQRGSKLAAGELEELMAVADINGDGEVDYHEFLATTVHQSRLEQEENLRYAFTLFDANGDGAISPAELRAALAGGAPGGGGGRSVTAAEVEDIMRAVDQDGNGQIEFEEFAAMMHGDGRHGGAAGGSGDGRSAMCSALGASASTAGLRAAGLRAAGSRSRAPASSRASSGARAGAGAAAGTAAAAAAAGAERMPSREPSAGAGGVVSAAATAAAPLRQGRQGGAPHSGKAAAAASALHQAAPPQQRGRPITAP